MIPRTVLAAQEVENTLTTADLENYGNTILNGYYSLDTAVTVAGTVGSIDAITFTGGTGYVDGSYPKTYLGGAKGTFGYADVTVAGGVVTAVTLTSGGNNFSVGQVLTLGNIPRSIPGTGATVTITAVNTKAVIPALKGWTNNYYAYYTELAPNSYNQLPGNPTMFEYSVHSYSEPTGPITSLVNLGGGNGYFAGTYTGLPAVGGSGVGATLDITIGSTGSIVLATVNSPGTGYTSGDGLTVASGIGPGSGFFVTVGPIAAPISSITVKTTGTGYSAGTYTGVTTTSNGFGTGATLDIVVGATGTIESAVLNAAGTNYAVGDSLVPDPTTIGFGSGLKISVASVATATGVGAQWAQPPQRYYQNQVSLVTPPQYTPNPEVIGYSFIYPIKDNPLPPPIGTL